MFGNLRNTYFNGQAVTYDEIGNPITFGSKSFEWCGRQLECITDGDNTLFYAISTVGRESEVLKMASKLGYVGD